MTRLDANITARAFSVMEQFLIKLSLQARSSHRGASRRAPVRSVRDYSLRSRGTQAKLRGRAVQYRVHSPQDLLGSYPQLVRQRTEC